MIGTDWRDQALCVATYGKQFDRQPPGIQVGVCMQCPVRLDCLTAALEFEENRSPARRDGIWGGTNPSQRYRLSKAVR